MSFQVEWLIIEKAPTPDFENPFLLPFLFNFSDKNSRYLRIFNDETKILLVYFFFTTYRLEKNNSMSKNKACRTSKACRHVFLAQQNWRRSSIYCNARCVYGFHVRASVFTE